MIQFLDPINNKLKTLLSRLTEARANNMDYLNAPVDDCAKTADERFNHLNYDLNLLARTSDNRFDHLDLDMSLAACIPKSSAVRCPGSGDFHATSETPTSVYFLSGAGILGQVRLRTEDYAEGHLDIYLDGYYVVTFSCTRGTSRAFGDGSSNFPYYASAVYNDQAPFPLIFTTSFEAKLYTNSGSGRDAYAHFWILQR